MAILNTHHVIPIVALGFFLLLGDWLYRYATCKVKQIPGPWYTKFTSSVLTWYTITGRQLHYIHRLHGQYGSVVRVSPAEVCVSDATAFHSIHKIGSGFTKSPWYRKFRTPDPEGSIDTFSSLDPRMHGAKRKQLARPFSNTSLRQYWEDMVVDKVKTTVGQIRKECLAKGSANVFKWWTFMTTDMIGLVAFGEDFQMSDTGVKPPFVNDLELVMMTGGIRATLPWVFHLLRIVTLGMWNPLQGPDDRIRQHGQNIMTNLQGRKLSKSNIFFGIQAAGEEDSSQHSIAYAAYEGSSLIVAGSGTTAVTLTYLVWAILKHPGVRETLQAELATLDEGYRDKDLEGLPYLSAVIQETLRLYGAAPGALPRVNYTEPLTANGYTIPSETTVSTQSWTLHRNPEVFPEPERFNPERWLNPTVEMKASFSPFGAGSRICLGMHLAYMELRHTAAHFFRELGDVGLAKDVPDSVMEVQHFFLIVPKGGRCEVALEGRGLQSAL